MQTVYYLTFFMRWCWCAVCASGFPYLSSLMPDNCRLQMAFLCNNAHYFLFRWQVPIREGKKASCFGAHESGNCERKDGAISNHKRFPILLLPRELYLRTQCCYYMCTLCTFFELCVFIEIFLFCARERSVRNFFCLLRKK